MAADGVADAVYRVAGNALFPGAQAPILRWLDDYEPAVLDAARRRVLQGRAFPANTGLRATDASDASLPFGDGRGGYSAELLRLCKLEHRASLLAPVVSPWPIGTVLGLRAARWDSGRGRAVRHAGVPRLEVASGGSATPAHDRTTLACQVLVDRIDARWRAGRHAPGDRRGDRWVRVMAAMVGTASLDWLLSMLGLRHEQLDGMLGGDTPGANGVRVLPYLAPSGERAPFVDRARGSSRNLARHHPRGPGPGALRGLGVRGPAMLDAARLSGRLVVCAGRSEPACTVAELPNKAAPTLLGPAPQRPPEPRGRLFASQDPVDRAVPPPQPQPAWKTRPHPGTAGPRTPSPRRAPGPGPRGCAERDSGELPARGRVDKTAPAPRRCEVWQHPHAVRAGRWSPPACRRLLVSQPSIDSSQSSDAVPTIAA